MNVPLSSPDISVAERAAVLDVLSGNTISLGPRLPEFEDAIAAATGAPFAVAVNSGTSALHLAVKALNIGPGDEVITSSFSFVASTNCFLYEGAIPRFVDIDPVSYDMSPEAIESAITSRTRAILPIHVFGRPCRMKAIMDIARKHGLAVIEDSCEALGATVEGRSAGTWGDAGVFAFYPNKQITTGEGGILVTADEKIAQLARSLRNQGRGQDSSWLHHERLGYNYRLSDINCAMGTVQVSRLSEILQRRAAVAALWDEKLARLTEFVRPSLASPYGDISWFVYVVRLQPEFSRADRDSILAGLRANGIGCNNYFSPIHQQPYIRESFGESQGALPITESVADRTIALPFFNHLTGEQIDQVVDVLEALVHQCPSRCLSVSFA
ncbi:DegT/DnrJ/EryC1/StrS family aminotransferase [Bryobacter aggregatus]|uniref:DegT/DnrJ/EryC1/StrS family aminotransferase n=1 Tax=Bryobacter aggregatus TaxID=360054 RepID=UPI0004E16472|nr:DegT/DnrJ/EryC1/StrS family aminotransferase [Bryobacter aggregatus]